MISCRGIDMVGDVFASEKKEITDTKTGNTVIQLTQKGINYHFYFTENSFDISNERIYFLSNRGCEGTEICNIFQMDLATGIMKQLTDDPQGVEHVTKTPDSELIAYVSENVIHVYNTRTKENRAIYRESAGMTIQNLSISCDKKWIGFARNEDTTDFRDGGPDYQGFREKMYATKDGRITVMRVNGTQLHDVHRDTCWLGHFQFSPDDAGTAMFCHEGPWNEVHQRIWMLDVYTGDFWPVFRQNGNDCVGHEFWTRNGDIVFDNRRSGHDGTISSTKEQLLKTLESEKEKPYFGFAHRDGSVYRTIEMPYYCNYYCNEDMSVFVGDAVEDIDLIIPKENSGAELIPLCRHNTTWKYQRSHCHPTFSWDGNLILYAADTDPYHDNLFLIDLKKQRRI